MQRLPSSFHAGTTVVAQAAARHGAAAAAAPSRGIGDQAQGLRQLFAGNAWPCLLPLLANPHMACSGLVLDRMAAELAASGRRVLVVDAGADAPPAHELARMDLAQGIETLAPRVAYLPARGLPLAYVDTRGSAAGFIDALQAAAPWADVLLLHAESSELARLLLRRPARVVLLGADHPESIKHAYAGAKLLAQRCGLLSFDLLLAAAAHSPRLSAIEQSLAQCLDGFIGAFLHHTAVIDPAAGPAAQGTGGADGMDNGAAALHTLLAAQLTPSEGPLARAMASAPAAIAPRTPTPHFL